MKPLEFSNRSIAVVLSFVAASTFVPSTMTVVAADVQTTKPAPKAVVSTVSRIPPPHNRPSAPPDIDMSRSIQLGGKVTDPTGRPAGGVHIFLTKDSWNQPVDLGVTNGDGAYQFVVPEKSFHRFEDGSAAQVINAWLIAAADEYGPQWIKLPLDEVKATAEGLGRWHVMKPNYTQDFRLVGDFPINGRIVNSSGEPVAGARILIGLIFPLSAWGPMHAAMQAGNLNEFNRNKNPPGFWLSPLPTTAWNFMQGAMTDSEGRFRFLGLGRDRVIGLYVDGPGVAPEDLFVITRDDVDEFTQLVRSKFPKVIKDGKVVDPGLRLFGPNMTVQLDAALTVAGTVRDAQTGDAIANLDFNNSMVRTDRNGRYRIVRSPNESTIWLNVETRRHDRYLPAVHRISASNDSNEIVHDINLQRGVVVSGRVQEAGTGRPIVSGARSTCHAPWSGALMTGSVRYVPLANNAALRKAPEGVYFEGWPGQTMECLGIIRSLFAEIQPDGQFRIAVPPGPGVILVRSQPGTPFMSEMLNPWSETAGMHRQYPYRQLTARYQNDGAPEGDTKSLLGFPGPLQIAEDKCALGWHAYRVINPSADQTAIDVTIEVSRSPSRVLRFVGPDGNPMRGLMVDGLVSSEHRLQVVLDGFEAEALALDAKQPREILAISSDGKYIGRDFVSVNDADPKTIVLEPSATVVGRLVDDTTGQPLTKYTIWTAYPTDDNDRVRHNLTQLVKTDAQGRFEINGLFPKMSASLSFQEPSPGFMKTAKVFSPDAVKNLILTSGETRDVGEIRIRQEQTEKK